MRKAVYFLIMVLCLIVMMFSCQEAGAQDKDHMTLPGTLDAGEWVIYPEPSTNVEVTVQEILQILERCQEFVSNLDQDAYEYTFSTDVYVIKSKLDVLLEAWTEKKTEAEQKIERFKRENQLRKDMDQLIAKLQLIEGGENATTNKGEAVCPDYPNGDCPDLDVQQ